MRRRHVIAAAVAAVAAFAAAAATTAAPQAHRAAQPKLPPHPLRTAIFDPIALPFLSSPVIFQHIRATGATAARLMVDWSKVAPATRPATFDPGNPADPAYRWSDIDGEVKNSLGAGVDPILDVVGAPGWAQESASSPGVQPNAGGTVRPDATQLALFARAAATRYSGSFQGLPRVRYWMVWNEPNTVYSLQPQYVDGQPASPAIYRRMVNLFAGAVHRAAPGNVVVAGGLSPYGDPNDPVAQRWGMPPLVFMRSLFCLSATLKPTCHDPVSVDVWSHHPYAAAGPAYKARTPGGASYGDLAKMRAILDAAQKRGQLVSAHRADFWVTEFGWDTNPPDPKGVPVKLHERWVAEALYNMWSQGVTLATWFLIRDEPFAKSTWQTGMYFRGNAVSGDRLKPSAAAFRFPFVAYTRGSRTTTTVWARVPTQRPATIAIEQSVGGPWRRIATLRADRYGIVQGTVTRRGLGAMRARGGAGIGTSLPFSLHVPDPVQYNPFGTF